MTITISLLSLSVNLRPTLPFLKEVLGILDILCSSKLKKKVLDLQLVSFIVH